MVLGKEGVLLAAGRFWLDEERKVVGGCQSELVKNVGKKEQVKKEKGI